MHYQCVGTTIPDRAMLSPSRMSIKPALLPYAGNETSLWITSHGRQGSFRIPLRFQPRDLARSVKPLISLGLAFEAIDVPNFSPGIMGFNLPIAIGDALDGKGDARRFAHCESMRREPADFQLR